MFLKHLINPKPSIIIFFIIFCFVFCFFPLLNSSVQNIFLHQWLNPYIVLLAGIIIPSFHALGLNNLIYEKNVIRKDNLVLGITYILLSTPFINNVTEWLTSFFLLFYLNYIFESYQKEYPFSQLFNASFILSILTFIFPELIFFSVLILISGINYGNLNWRNISVSIIGIVTPYIFYFIYTYISDTPFNLPKIAEPTIINFSFDFILPKLIWIITLLIISLFSFIELFNWLYKKSIQSRRSFLIVFFYFLLILGVILLGWLESWVFLITPLCIIIGNYFTYTKNRKIANLLFLLLVISSFYYKYFIAL